MSNLIVDTGVWLAFVDPREAYDHEDELDALYEMLEGNRVVMPWPLAYETLRTRLARSRQRLTRIERELRSPRIEWIDDGPYRDAALHLFFESSIREFRPLSMVDCLIRLILDDRRVKIDSLLTFNPADFEDVCRKHRIGIMP
jgi:predicted nucleic acid-binding protein